MMYKACRNYENLNRQLFKGDGKYDIPQLCPVYGSMSLDWIPFNYAMGCKDPFSYGVHFFVDDYQFIRLWNNPDKYTEILRRFNSVLTPDFSTYFDMPKVIQIYNHYRKHWLGAYWQAQGLYVIPTISWSDEDSFEWCFDGEPVGGIVAISSVGTQRTPRAKELFNLGFKKMVEVLRPYQIMIYGSYIPDGYSDIIAIEPFQNKWR